MSAPPPRRNASAPAASTTTSIMSAIPRAITRFSKCSAISPLAIISRSRPLRSPGSLIVKDFGLPKDKLLVTVYHDDDEAFGLWKKIAGFSDDRIIRISSSDNFWSMGETGPCGPCSEIFFDQGESPARRAARQPRRGRRPVPGILEPRLHAIRAGRARPARSPAPPVDRHRHGAGAHRRADAGRATPITTSTCSAP